ISARILIPTSALWRCADWWRRTAGKTARRNARYPSGRCCNRKRRKRPRPHGSHRENVEAGLSRHLAVVRRDRLGWRMKPLRWRRKPPLQLLVLQFFFCFQCARAHGDADAAFARARQHVAADLRRQLLWGKDAAFLAGEIFDEERGHGGGGPGNRRAVQPLAMNLEERTDANVPAP